MPLPQAGTQTQACIARSGDGISETLGPGPSGLGVC